MPTIRLGEKLVQDRRITAAELEVALRAQVIYGGRLGTNLVELGHIDLDTLSRALAEIHGVPAALQKHFEQVAGDAATIDLLPMHLAEKHQAVPLGLARLAGRQLVIAFMDPLHTGAVEEIGEATGTRITQCVAAELRILYYLERFYGIPRKNRYLRIDQGLGQPAPHDHDHADIPGLEVSLPPARAGTVPRGMTVSPRSIASPTRPPTSNSGLSAAGSAVPRQTGGSGLDAASGSAHVRPSISGLAAAAPSAAARPERASSLTGSALGAAMVAERTVLERLAAERAAAAAPPPAPAPAPPAQPPPPARAALSARDAASQISTATTRDDVGDFIVDYLRSAFGCGLVLIVKDGMALGWKGFAPGVDSATIESIATPLGAPSMFKLAHDGRSVFRGAPPAEGAALQARVWKPLRVEPPAEVVVAPITLNKRVVNLVYANPADGGTLPEGVIGDMATVCTAAATAFARLIRAKPRP